jgi:hypothetical protein
VITRAVGGTVTAVVQAVESLQEAVDELFTSELSLS